MYDRENLKALKKAKGGDHMIAFVVRFNVSLTAQSVPGQDAPDHTACHPCKRLVSRRHPLTWRCMASSVQMLDPVALEARKFALAEVGVQCKVVSPPPPPKERAKSCTLHATQVMKRDDAAYPAFLSFVEHEPRDLSHM